MSAENKQILQALLENSAILTETTQPFSLYPYPLLSECLRVFMFYSRPPYGKQWLSSYHDAALRYSEEIMTIALLHTSKVLSYIYKAWKSSGK